MFWIGMIHNKSKILTTVCAKQSKTKLLDNLWQGLGKSFASILAFALFDLSEALNAINQWYLSGFQEGGSVLCWFVSFLWDSYQSVLIGARDSALSPYCFSLPSYSTFTWSHWIIQHHGVRNHQYTDDSQLYISASGKFSNAVDVLSQCLNVARNWIKYKKLQLNLGITKWLWVLRIAGSTQSLGW